MLELFAIILAVLWILSMAVSYSMGGFIHSFLIFAIAIIVYRVVTKQECY
ncbi:MAG: lmo0937 family membrane protein [Chlorobiaceae bacterium]|nr:lmo0937 family membrane protein [Chlorobiaceae bacterium]